MCVCVLCATVLTQTLQFKVYQCLGGIAGILNNFNASLIVVYVENMIASDGAILILWRMPGHGYAGGGDIQYGEILRLAWHCKERDRDRECKRKLVKSFAQVKYLKKFSKNFSRSSFVAYFWA